MRKYFGTDGVRGLINSGKMTPEVILRLAMATGFYFKSNVGRHLVVIGKDTRLSGYMLEPLLVAGFTAAGMDAVTVGPVPTPAIAQLTKSLRADAGIMISASHNPFHDNGIKLFGADGYKLSDASEKEIEKLMDGDLKDLYAPAHKLGRAMRLNDVSGRYTEHVKTALPVGVNLKPFKIALDTANGAAYKLAPCVFKELGADLIQMGAEPNGFNINEGVGATNPAALAKFVVKNNADIGFALDGDADRLVVVDEKGKVIDGDQIIALIATYLKSEGKLNSSVVTTIMANIGLNKYFSKNSIDMITTDVGDRYVVEKMRICGSNFGGEQSGHLILSDYSTTGDGIVAALYVLSAMVKQSLPASKTCDCFTPYPQILQSVKVKNFAILDSPTVKACIKNAEDSLAQTGRVLIRKSGTEPVIRVMAQGRDLSFTEKVVLDIVRTIEKLDTKSRH